MKKHIFRIFILIILLSVTVLLIIKFGNKVTLSETPSTGYIASDINEVMLYDEEYNESIKLTRGNKVYVYSKEIKNEENTYKKIKYNNKEYLVNVNNLVKKEDSVIKEEKLFVRTNATIYKSLDSAEILSYVKKGENVEIVGFDKLNEDGSVNKYRIKYNGYEGYVYSKYLVSSEEDSKKLYDENNIQEYMKKMGNTLGAGSAVNLDYYPYEKPKFEDNVMPDEVRA